MLEILSFGAGVQSTTLLCMSCDGVLPRLDVAIFADTQWEPKRVYRHLEWCKEKAAKAGIPILISTAGNIRDDVIGKYAKGTRAASLPFYVTADTSRGVGIMPRQCTKEYKIEVVEREIRAVLGLQRRQRWPLTPAVRQWIGISADEVQRRRISLRPAVVNYYPLLETLSKPTIDLYRERGFTRQDCLDWMRDAGYPNPPRSACIGCPFRSDDEWARMRSEDPGEFAEAVEVDREIRSGGSLRGEPYLHSSLIPLDMVTFKPANDHSEGRGMVNECQGMCGL